MNRSVITIAYILLVIVNICRIKIEIREYLLSKFDTLSQKELSECDLLFENEKKISIITEEKFLRKINIENLVEILKTKNIKKIETFFGNVVKVKFEKFLKNKLFFESEYTQEQFLPFSNLNMDINLDDYLGGMVTDRKFLLFILKNFSKSINIKWYSLKEILKNPVLKRNIDFSIIKRSFSSGIWYYKTFGTIKNVREELRIFYRLLLDFHEREINILYSILNGKIDDLTFQALFIYYNHLLKIWKIDFDFFQNINIDFNV